MRPLRRASIKTTDFNNTSIIQQHFLLSEFGKLLKRYSSLFDIPAVQPVAQRWGEVAAVEVQVTVECTVHEESVGRMPQCREEEGSLSYLREQRPRMGWVSSFSQRSSDPPSMARAMRFPNSALAICALWNPLVVTFCYSLVQFSPLDLLGNWLGRVLDSKWTFNADPLQLVKIPRHSLEVIQYDF
jgi:hypothetical protein